MQNSRTKMKRKMLLLPTIRVKSIHRSRLRRLERFGSDMLVYRDKKLIVVMMVILQLDQGGFEMKKPGLVVLDLEQDLVQVRAQVVDFQPVGFIRELLHASVAEDFDEFGKPVGWVEASHGECCVTWLVL
jgi:hypothetical protein